MSKDPSWVESHLENELPPPKKLQNSTIQSLTEISLLVSEIHNDRKNITTMVDVGCGYGLFSESLGNLLEVDFKHGIESDRERRKTAREQGLTVHNIDVEHAAFPFGDDEVDLVTSFGLLEHLTWYDNVLSETSRVLRDGGYALFAMPNMAGWTNRLSLLTGHQPRNVEFSQEEAFGILDAYGTSSTVGHVHTPTVGAFEEFLEHHGFEVVDTVGLHPYQRGRLVALIDRVVSRRPSLCRRFAVLARLPTTE